MLYEKSYSLKVVLKYILDSIKKCYVVHPEQLQAISHISESWH